MQTVREWLARLVGTVWPRRTDRDLEEELRTHTAFAIEDEMARGRDPRDARRAAAVGAGQAAPAMEALRDQRGVRWVGNLLRDVRYGVRGLRRDPAFTCVAVLTLGLGIGSTTAIFSVVYAGLVNPWPYKDSDRLVVLVSQRATQPRVHHWTWVSPAEFLDYQDQNHVFDEVIGGLGEGVLLTGAGQVPERLSLMRLTLNTFKVMAASPLIGRLPTADDAAPNAPPVVLLDYGVWQKKFGGDRAILGRTVFLDHRAATVIGVMPPRFKWYGEPDLWAPEIFKRSDNSGTARTTAVIGHLKPGVTVAQANADLGPIVARLARQYPQAHPAGDIVLLRTLTDATVDRQSQQSLRVLMAAVGFLLLIACVNIANLLLARGSARTRELAIRASLGASRSRLVGQLFIENALLAGAGAGLGALLAWCTLGVLAVVVPSSYTPAEAVIRMNVQVLLFAAGAGVLSTLAFGLAPAVISVNRDLALRSNASGRADGDDGGHHRLRQVLLASEVALALVLLVGATLLFRSFWALQHVELGYDAAHVLQSGAVLPVSRYATPAQRNRFKIEITRRVRSLPGVLSADFGGWRLDLAGPSLSVEVAGQSRSAWVSFVGDRFFDTVGIRLLEGRPFSEADIAQERRVAIVNRIFVNAFLEGANALGRPVHLMPPPKSWVPADDYEIVGVVGDTAHIAAIQNPGPSVQPQVFVPGTVGALAAVIVFAKTAGDPASLTGSVRREFAALDSELPMQEGTAVADALQQLYKEPRFETWTLGGFGLLGLALVTVGVYGVLSYSVLRRTHEIGLRMALGADAARMGRWAVRIGMAPLLAGLGIGAAASSGLSVLLQHRIWGMTPADPWTLAGVCAVVTGVGLAAAFIPARRAMKVDPLVALKFD